MNVILSISRVMITVVIIIKKLLILSDLYNINIYMAAKKKAVKKVAKKAVKKTAKKVAKKAAKKTAKRA